MHVFQRALVSRVKMFVPILLTLSAGALFAAPNSAKASTARTLGSFQNLALGATLDQLKSAHACDKAGDLPGVPESSSLGLSSTICPAAETFAMATLLDQRVVAISVNWISWQGGKLLNETKVQAIPAALRLDYGIPEATVAYESQFGNRESDKFCSQESKQCLIHIWRSVKDERVASLVYAKVGNSEMPLLLSVNDLKGQKILQGRVQNQMRRADATTQNETLAH